MFYKIFQTMCLCSFVFLIIVVLIAIIKIFKEKKSTNEKIKIGEKVIAVKKNNERKEVIQ